MSVRPKRRFWRICRIYFRRLRISVWLLVLAILGAVIYVNQVGLPEFAKRPLLEKLKQRGLDFQFSRLRLSWYQGIVAENVHFWPTFAPASPHLSVDEVQVRLNWKALAHLQLQVDSLMLRQGRVAWPFGGTNQSQELSVTNIQTDLRFLPGDQWALDNLRADFVGARIQLMGVVTNASAVRDWQVFRGQQPASRSAQLWQSRAGRLADTLEHIHFSAPPELRVNLRGDALDLHTFSVLLSLSAPGAQTPWGNLSGGHFFARLQSVDTNGVSRAELNLQSGSAQTPWATVTNLSLTLRLSSAEQQTNLVNCEINLSAAQVQTRWAQGTNALFTATWVHSITNPIPISGQGIFSCWFAQTAWGSASQIALRGNLLPAPGSETSLPPDPSWGWWTNLAPFQLSWDCSLSNLVSPRLAADRISCAGDWLAPHLALTNFDATLFDGRLAAHGDINVATRAAHLNLLSDLDPHRSTPYLPDSARLWLSRFSWPKPPRLATELACTLPTWTNSHSDWRAEVQPTLLLRGELTFEQGATYRELRVTSAHSHFVYSNQCWRLPDAIVTRPEGQLSADLFSDEVSTAFYSRVSSTIDPAALKPLLGERAKKAMDLFSFSQPPQLDAEVWGHGSDPDRIGARGRLLLSNVTFRGESITRVQTSIDYTNRVLRFFDPRVDASGRVLTADALVVDLDPQLIYLTNGVSNADPMLVARAIGPHIVRAIENYQFRSPPNARVYGVIPFHGEAGADLHFDLTGGPFHWWKFNIPLITGQVHWSGLHLSLTNVQAEFYHGLAGAWAAFDFLSTPGTDFEFALSATNVLLQSLMADLSSSTNHLEGRVYGTLVVTKANTENWQSVFGYGDAHLHDGLLWDIPLFGIFSPVLNGIAPGMGNSRASAATASYTITNGVIRTPDLDIRCTGMRLQYRGTVNLEGQLNARVDAELLRDMWLVGPLVSTVFWPVTKLFEYRVSGTLSDPRSEPVFLIPKIMLMPFHPFRTLKGLRPEDPNSNPNFSPLPP